MGFVIYLVSYSTLIVLQLFTCLSLCESMLAVLSVQHLIVYWFSIEREIFIHMHFAIQMT